MEKKLEDFIKRIETISDVRNRDRNNSVTFTLQHPDSKLKESEDPILFRLIASQLEPENRIGFPIPINLIWICFDSTHAQYRKALKRISDNPSSDRASTWHQLETYDEIFRDVQHFSYDSSLVGAPGPQGEKGDQGERGIQGEQGERGFVGPRGIQGEQGEKGDTGEQGPQGIQGFTGSTGPKGDKGDVGEKGEKGDIGPQGEPGQEGVDHELFIETTLELNKARVTEANSMHRNIYDIRNSDVWFFNTSNSVYVKHESKLEDVLPRNRIYWNEQTHKLFSLNEDGTVSVLARPSSFTTREVTLSDDAFIEYEISELFESYGSPETLEINILVIDNDDESLTKGFMVEGNSMFSIGYLGSKIRIANPSGIEQSMKIIFKA